MLLCHGVLTLPMPAHRLPCALLCRGWTQSSKHMPSRLSVITGPVSFGASRIPVSHQSQLPAGPPHVQSCAVLCSPVRPALAKQPGEDV